MQNFWPAGAPTGGPPRPPAGAPVGGPRPRVGPVPRVAVGGEPRRMGLGPLSGTPRERMGIPLPRGGGS